MQSNCKLIQAYLIQNHYVCFSKSLGVWFIFNRENHLLKSQICLEDVLDLQLTIIFITDSSTKRHFVY